jgi:zinc D-Ala-D-Ala carboxypeptidase
MDWSKIKYFTEDEFRCRCGCGKAEMDEFFVKTLDQVRDELGFPLVITSGYRCPDWNEQVSSSGRSGPHTTGKAADVGVSYARARKFITLAVTEFMGVGVKQHGVGRFIHVDMLEPRLWTYP